MEGSAAIEALRALAQESRLGVFRMLVERGPRGMPAGDIARDLEIPANTLSTHLAILARAHMVRSRREARSIIYRADFDGVRALLAFLMQDCCRGRPELCGPLLDRALAPCCGTTKEAARHEANSHQRRGRRSG